MAATFPTRPLPIAAREWVESDIPVATALVLRGRALVSLRANKAVRQSRWRYSSCWWGACACAGNPHHRTIRTRAWSWIACFRLATRTTGSAPTTRAETCSPSACSGRPVVAAGRLRAGCWRPPAIGTVDRLVRRYIGGAVRRRR